MVLSRCLALVLRELALGGLSELSDPCELLVRNMIDCFTDLINNHVALGMIWVIESVFRHDQFKAIDVVRCLLFQFKSRLFTRQTTGGLNLSFETCHRLVDIYQATIGSEWSCHPFVRTTLHLLTVVKEDIFIFSCLFNRRLLFWRFL